MAGIPYYSIVPCCSSSGTALSFFNFPTTAPQPVDGVYRYVGLETTINGITFTTGYCYTITEEDAVFGLFPQAPSSNDFSETISGTCEDSKCECEEVLTCYTLYTCDGTFFNTTTDLSANVGTYIRIEGDTRTWYVIQDPTKITCNNAADVVLDTVSLKTPCVLTCYQVTGTPTSVTYMDANYDIITVIGAVKVCSYITPIVTGAGSGFVLELGLCVEGECPEICFEFTNCQTEEVLVVSNSPSIIPYYAQNQIVTLQGYDGCWSIDITEICECPVSVTILTAYASCSACLPIVNYKFTNCNNQSIIRYSIDDYSAYVGKTVELECGECWFVSEIDYIPPSTQTIVILYTFDNCIACNRTYYKLTDCLDPTNITYTYTDLSSVIPTPIGCDCISVTYQLDGEDPVTVEVESSGMSFGKPSYLLDIGIELPCYLSFNIIGEYPFQWELTNDTFRVIDVPHLNSNTPCPFGIYTIEEGSIFLAFKVEPCSSLPVVKIEGCDTCFTLEETREPVNAGIVTVTDSYIDCPECLETFPCVCNKITNQDTIAKDFTYLNCLFEEVTINLQPNETSDKVCLINWVLTPEEEALVYIEHFGDCINGQCPVVPLPKRKVKPGYSVPTCDIEKYEKITCRSSEILYKQVIRLRYGISNCCPEDDEKWLIKKELIDLDALRDPDYICKPVTTCCNQPITSCGCDCNSTLKTCNS
jgi:hypothetical protein